MSKTPGVLGEKEREEWLAYPQVYWALCTSLLLSDPRFQY